MGEKNLLSPRVSEVSMLYLTFIPLDTLDQRLSLALILQNFQDKEENLESFQNYLASSGNGGQAGDGDIKYNKNVETIQFS